MSPTTNESPTFRSSREVILRTENWTEAISFYGSVLGLPVAYRTATMVGFETGAFRLYVEKGAAHAPVFELLVSDLETARRQLLEAGCTIVEEDHDMPRCYIRDPYGFTFNVARSAEQK